MIMKTKNKCSTIKPITTSKVKRKRKLVKPTDSEPTLVDNNVLLRNYEDLYSAITKGEQLTDRHIDAANHLLLDKFPELQGLSTPILGQKFSFPVFCFMLAASGYPYIQILHIPENNHWITIQITLSEEVNVYDSLFDQPSYDAKKQIASIIHSRRHYINLFMEKTQLQENTVDCGVYSIAFATDLCHQIDPATRVYDQKLLRPHLLACLQEGQITPFPAQEVTRINPLKVRMRIYCKCRLPYVMEHLKKKEVNLDNDDSKMIECDTCDEWFHEVCINIDPKTLLCVKKNPTIKWMCDDCVVSFNMLSSSESD